MIPMIWAIYTQSPNTSIFFCPNTFVVVLEPAVPYELQVLLVVARAASEFVSTIQSVLSDQGSDNTC